MVVEGIAIPLLVVEGRRDGRHPAVDHSAESTCRIARRSNWMSPHQLAMTPATWNRSSSPTGVSALTKLSSKWNGSPSGPWSPAARR